MPYQQSTAYQRVINQENSIKNTFGDTNGKEELLLKFVKENTEPNNIDSVIDGIDKFCAEHWMMNLGPEKGDIVDIYTKKREINNVIEIGGYCGYSALRFARANPTARILTIQVNERYAGIAHEIHKHAGVGNRITINLGNVEQSEQAIAKAGPFDLVFIDHLKQLYLSDLELLEKYGVVRKGALVVGDNIITPGCPKYLAAMRNRQDYDNVLEHTFLEYCDVPDAILFSQKLT